MYPKRRSLLKVAVVVFSVFVIISVVVKNEILSAERVLIKSSRSNLLEFFSEGLQSDWVSFCSRRLYVFCDDTGNKNYIENIRQKIDSERIKGLFRARINLTAYLSSPQSAEREFAVDSYYRVNMRLQSGQPVVIHVVNPQSWLVGDFKKIRCPVSACVFDMDGVTEETDVVMAHGVRLTDGMLPGQLYVMYGRESPVHYYSDLMNDKCLGKSDLTVTDTTKSICPNGSVVVSEIMKFKVRLNVEKIDIKHRILINIKNSKSEKVKYCNIDLDNCDTVMANSTCYCLLKEDKVFNAKVQIKASLNHNGTTIIAEHYEDELLTTTQEHTLPLIHGEPSAELEVNDVHIDLQNCVMNLPSEEPYRVQFCTKNLFSPDLDIYWKTNDPYPTHSEKKECIRKRIPLAPNSTLLRFTYKDRCTRSQEYKCQVYGRSKSETTTLGPTTMKYYFYWFLPIPIIVVVIVIVSPMLYMFIVQGVCLERSRSVSIDTTTRASSTPPSYSSDESNSAE